jgi:hypothetical protein
VIPVRRHPLRRHQEGFYFKFIEGWLDAKLAAAIFLNEEETIERRTLQKCKGKILG